LSLLLVAGKIYPIHVMPSTLVNSVSINMEILEYFGIKNIVKQINRYNLKYGNKLYSFNELTGMNEKNYNLIMSDSSIKAILLNNIQDGNNMMFKNIKSKLSNAFIIFDEVDEISDPFKCELNYPITEYQKKDEFLSLKLDLYIQVLKLFYCIEFKTPNSVSDISLNNPNNFIDHSIEEYYFKPLINIYSIKVPITNEIKNKIFSRNYMDLANLINTWLDLGPNIYFLEPGSEDDVDVLIDNSKFYNRIKDLRLETKKIFSTKVPYIIFIFI